MQLKVRKKPMRQVSHIIVNHKYNSNEDSSKNTWYVLLSDTN